MEHNTCTREDISVVTHDIQYDYKHTFHALLEDWKTQIGREREREADWKTDKYRPYSEGHQYKLELLYTYVILSKEYVYLKTAKVIASCLYNVQF